ncbi:hypothetical protein CEXT_456591 [Caerostris extrusa]|uniref:Uncharacterized protein n=1 Tax=Caerostris extrusa TaxID=172846 RepID=A0AAV4MN09_CAEEX|nr:hypothetical protein CEXT_456591 [Caerostris extrusa]
MEGAIIGSSLPDRGMVKKKNGASSMRFGLYALSSSTIACTTRILRVGFMSSVQVLLFRWECFHHTPAKPVLKASRGKLHVKGTKDLMTSLMSSIETVSFVVVAKIILPKRPVKMEGDIIGSSLPDRGMVKKKKKKWVQLLS